MKERPLLQKVVVTLTALALILGLGEVALHFSQLISDTKINAASFAPLKQIPGPRVDITGGYMSTTNPDTSPPSGGSTR